MEFQPVYSSHIDSLAYDDATSTLHVRYSKGNTAIYEGVPANVAAQVMQAPSIGTALHSLVRGQFPHKYGA